MNTPIVNVYNVLNTPIVNVYNALCLPLTCPLLSFGLFWSSDASRVPAIRMASVDEYEQTAQTPDYSPGTTSSTPSFTPSTTPIPSATPSIAELHTPKHPVTPPPLPPQSPPRINSDTEEVRVSSFMHLNDLFKHFDDQV